MTNKPSLPILLVAGILSSLLGAGCSTTCTNIGCQSAVRVTLTQPLTSGKYQIAVAATAGDAMFEPCTINFASPTKLATDCPATINGVASATSVSQLEFVFSGSRPSEVTITITPAGGAATTATKSLVFTGSQPNGPDCAPTCYQANTTL